MKIKTIVTLSLLFIMSFSFVSEHLLAFYADEPCATTSLHESEFDIPEVNVDIHCEIHCEYHNVFLQPKYNIFTVLDTKNTLEILSNNSYLFKTNLKISKPPIT